MYKETISQMKIILSSFIDTIRTRINKPRNSRK